MATYYSQSDLPSQLSLCRPIPIHKVYVKKQTGQDGFSYIITKVQAITELTFLNRQNKFHTLYEDIFIVSKHI
jgi:hypothetical protein